MILDRKFEGILDQGTDVSSSTTTPPRRRKAYDAADASAVDRFQTRSSKIVA